jgi:hypothetical protein
MTIATPEHLPPRPISSICIGTPSKLAPPNFGRRLADLIFHLRAHGIATREPEPGMTLAQAYTASLRDFGKGDAFLWLDGDVDFRTEDALACISALREGIDVCGLLVPAYKPIDYAWIRRAVKERVSTAKLSAAGLSFDLDFRPEDVTSGRYEGPIKKCGDRILWRVETLAPGAIAMMRQSLDGLRENVSDSAAIGWACATSNDAWVIQDAPTRRQVPGGVELGSREPEWSLAKIAAKQAPLVESDWRSERDFSITTVAFNKNVEQIFEPVAAMLYEGLREAGFDVTLTPVNCVDHARRTPIILGAHLKNSDVDIPPGAIVYYAEQPAEAWADFAEEEATFYRPGVIWSWSDATTKILKRRCLPVVTLPLGFVDSLLPSEAIQPPPSKDIDVLFYGGLTQRRREILGALQQKGLRVQYERACWGVKREELIARSKVVLNIRGNDFGPEGGVFEAVRALPLMARGVAVVSEKGEGWDRFQSGCRFVDSPSEIPEAVEELVGDYGLRHFLEGEAVKSVRAQPQSNFLKQLFEGVGE